MLLRLDYEGGHGVGVLVRERDRAQPSEGDAHHEHAAVAVGARGQDDVLPQALRDHALVVVGEVGVDGEHVRLEAGLARGGQEAALLEVLGAVAAAR